MANTGFRRAARLVLATFAAHVWAHDGSADDMMQQLMKMRNSIHHGQNDLQQQGQSAQNYYDSQSTGAGQQSVEASQQAAGDYYDSQATQAQQGYDGSQDTGEGMSAMTTHKPGFMKNSSPKNRAIITGVVAGAGVAAVAGGIAIAIEENKIQKRRREGKPVKPIFPWMAKKAAGPGGANQMPWGSPGGSSHSGSRPSPSARASSGDEGSATVPPTLPPTMAPTLPPTTTTGAPKLGDEIPMVVWIALGVLACCCLAALICACVEAVRHGSGRKKRTVRSTSDGTSERPTSRDTLRSDSLDSDYSPRSDDGSFYDQQSYSQVAPQELYYPSAQHDPSQQYAQQAAYQTADNLSYQSAGGLSYSEYTPQASYALTDASHYTQYTESAKSYVPSLHYENPHPNAEAYVNPNDGLFYYNTNG